MHYGLICADVPLRTYSVIQSLMLSYHYILTLKVFRNDMQETTVSFRLFVLGPIFRFCSLQQQQQIFKKIKSHIT